MSLKTLLHILADGEYHSGTDLGEQLGISRAAVWKQLKKVEELGLVLLSTKSKGYKIEGGIDLLSHDAITQALDSSARKALAQLQVVDVVPSTNDLALEALARDVGRVAITTERQTAGRGRRGRRWVSPYGANVYLSIGWEYESGIAALSGLSLAAGVVIVEALEQLGVGDLRLKWPNDILHSSSKLAGILIDISGDAQGPCRVALGVGLNVCMPASAANEIDQAWTDLNSICDVSFTRNQLCAELINHLIPMLATFESDGFKAYQERWISRDASAGQMVTLETSGRTERGRAHGVDDSGALIIVGKQGEQRFQGGDLTLRH